MSEQVEIGPGPVAQNAPFLPQINIAQYSVEEFAKSLVEFYNALIAAGIEKSFAQKLTVAFCQRP